MAGEGVVVLVPNPLETVTATSVFWASARSAGLSAVISVGLTSWTLVAVTPLNRTVEVGPKPVPSMVTAVLPPTGPRAGETAVTVGGTSMSGPVAWQNDWAAFTTSPVSSPLSSVICIPTTLMLVPFREGSPVRSLTVCALSVMETSPESGPSCPEVRPVSGGIVEGRLTVVPPIDRPVTVVDPAEPAADEEQDVVTVPTSSSELSSEIPSPPARPLALAPALTVSSAWPKLVDDVSAVKVAALMMPGTPTGDVWDAFDAWPSGPRVAEGIGPRRLPPRSVTLMPYALAVPLSGFAACAGSPRRLVIVPAAVAKATAAIRTCPIRVVGMR